MSRHLIWISWYEHHKPYPPMPGREPTGPAPIFMARDITVDRHHEVAALIDQINHDPTTWLRTHGHNPDLCISPEASAQPNVDCHQCATRGDRRLITRKDAA